ncbi:MAG: hypothetical protein NVS3B5_18460 [Sphingomicrobium sp.]
MAGLFAHRHSNVFSWDLRLASIWAIDLTTLACSGWRDGQCTAWNRLTKKQEAEVQVGTVFGPNYSYYSDYKTLPSGIVTQYSLSPDFRLVSADGYIYVVDPHSYAVTRVIAPRP